MPCESCGKEIKVNAKFCPFCGASVIKKEVRESSPTGSTEVGEPASPKGVTERKRRRLTILIVIAGVLISVIALVAIIPRNDFRDYKQATYEMTPAPVPNQPPSSKPVEKRAPTHAEIENMLIRKTRQYFEILGGSDFDANKYYASQVDKYYNRESLTPEDINDLYYKGFYPEFGNPAFEFKESSFDLQISGESYVLYFEGIFTCYRKSKKKFQFSRVKTAMTYNKDFQIRSIYEEDIWDVRFTDSP